MERPSNLIYCVSEKPPTHICVLSAAQLLTVVAPFLIYPVLIIRAVGASEDAAVDVVGLTFFVLGIGAILQALTCKWLGSGYLIAIGCASSYFPGAIAAFKSGGFELLTGMTLLAGLFETVFAQIVVRLRAFFPTEISGLCILLIGIIIGILGLGTVFGLDIGSVRVTATMEELGLTSITLALMIGLNLWGTGQLRMFSAVIGIVAGCVAAILLGSIDTHSLAILAASPLFSLPHWKLNVPAFSLELVVPFVAAALTNALRGMGDISIAQKINDREWVRPDMKSIRNGITANGFTTIAAAIAGTIGTTTLSSSIGMSNAVGVTSRQVGYWLGGMLLVLSAFPVVSAIFIVAPRPVVGASLLFTSCFIVVSGLQVITARMLDPRRTFTIGLALTLGLSRDLLPSVYESAPQWLQPFTTSGLAVGLFSALILNAIFRIGIRSHVSRSIVPGSDIHDVIRVFLEQQGAQWGARRDVVERAIFGTAQAVESVIEHCDIQDKITIEVSFDEFNFDVRISYKGELLAIEDHRPTDREIRETDDGVRRLAGYLLRKNADGVRTATRDARSTLEFHFIH